MYKFMTICLFALLALASAKPHLLTTGISYATPAVAATPVAAVATPIAAAAAFATPVFASSGYYPAYTAPYYGYGYGSYGPYATYPYFGSTYFVRR